MAANGNGRAAWTLGVIAVLLVLVTVWLVWPYRGAIVFALVLAFLLWPLQERLAPKVRRRGIAAGILLLGFTVAVIAPVVAVVWSLVNQFRDVSDVIAEEGIRGFARDTLISLGLPRDVVNDALPRVVSEVGGFFQAQLSGAFGVVTHFILALVVFYVLLWYLLVDGAHVIAFLKRISPLGDEGTERLLHAAGGRTQAVIYGSLVVAVVQGVVAGLGWWILGLPAPLFWGTTMTVMSIFPVLGAFVVLLPATVWALAQGMYVTAGGLLVLNFIAVGLIDDVLRPVLVGRWSQVHPAVVLVGLVGGLAVFGLAGIVLGPLVVSLVGPVLEAWAGTGRGELSALEEA